MTQDKPPERASGAPDAAPKGDRIAKVLARAGVASRRDAEKIIEAGRVAVNGKILDRAAYNVSPGDEITVDGQPIAEAEPARLWLYHKPAGLVTTNRDEKDRATIFDHMPDDLPRVMSVGRLDINSEGLLLLTNDGDIKRKLELPSTGWLRRYRVRVNGRPTEDTFAPLRKGITVEGEQFQPMQVSLDRQQGANAWLTVGLREGKNREIRRAMQDIGLTVNRLIRISYGPFQLGDLKQGAVEEVRRKVMRDQLGLEAEEPTGTAKKKTVTRPDRKFGASRKPSEQGRTRDRARAEYARDKAANPGGRFGKPQGAAAEKPFGKPSGRAAGKFAGKPAGKSPGTPGAEPGQKRGGKPAGPPRGKPKR